MTIERINYLHTVWIEDQEPDAREMFLEAVLELWPALAAVIEAAQEIDREPLLLTPARKRLRSALGALREKGTEPK